MRTFQYSDEKSHKFWNIELSGNDVTVTYGRVGSAGQTQTKTIKDAAAALKEEYGFHSGGYLFTHRRGWLDTLEVGRMTVPFARLLAQAPQTRLLRTLRIDDTTMYWDDDDEGTFEPGPDVPEGVENASLY